MAGPDAGHRRRPLVAVRRRPPRARGRLVVGQRLDLHDPGPVLPVAVGDEEQDRRAEGQAVADAADDLGPVVLDRLAGAAAVAALAPGEVDRERRPRSGRGRPGTPSIVTPSDRPCDSPAVRKRRRPIELGRPSAARSGRRVGAGRGRGSSPAGSPSAERTPPARAVGQGLSASRSSGAGWPVHSVNAAAPWWSSISSPSATVQPAASASRSRRVRL